MVRDAFILTFSCHLSFGKFLREALDFLPEVLELVALPIEEVAREPRLFCEADGRQDVRIFCLLVRIREVLRLDETLFDEC